MRPYGMILAAMILVGTGAPAGAETFRGSKGLSFDYPDGWIAATNDQRDQILKCARAQIKGMWDSDLEDVEAVVHAPAFGGFTANAIILRIGRTDDVDTIKKQIEQGFEESAGVQGLSVWDFDCQIVDVNGRDAVSIEWEVAYRNSIAARQWMVIIPTTGRSYAVICTATPGEFEQLRPKLTAMIDSLEIYGGPFGIWYEMPLWLRGGLLVIGPLLALKILIGLRNRGVARQQIRAMPPATTTGELWGGTPSPRAEPASGPPDLPLQAGPPTHNIGGAGMRREDGRGTANATPPKQESLGTGTSKTSGICPESWSLKKP